MTYRLRAHLLALSALTLPIHVLRSPNTYRASDTKTFAESIEAIP